MRTRNKFISLIIFYFGAFFWAIILFMSTDYARQEKAYFRSYPYDEMAARHTAPITPRRETVTARSSFEKDMPLPEPVTAPISINQERVTAEIPIPTDVTSFSHIPKALPPLPRRKIPAESITTPAVAQSPPLRKKSPQPPAKADWRRAAERGYDAYKKSNYKAAITHFEHALQLSPHNHTINLQLAYAHKKIGQNNRAIKYFKTAIDHEPRNFTLRREVEQLENRFAGSAYVIYRDESSPVRPLGADLTQSQAGMEISYQPKNVGYKNGRKIQVYARFLSGMEQDKLTLNPDSYQGGIGLRIKPLSQHNLVLSAERLVKLGKFARNDWMIRAGYSRDFAADYQQDKIRWWSYSLYLDAALIKPTNPDIFLTSQFTGGHNFSIGKGLVLQPRMTALISWQKDEFHQSSLLESGPGLNLRYYFNETKYAAYRSYIDLTVEYRVKISGNSVGGSGPVMSLLLHF